jgi:hypothetical protein
MNLTVQIFTFDRSVDALTLFRFLLPLFKVPREAKLAFGCHDGRRRTAAIDSVSEGECIVLNEGYVRFGIENRMKHSRIIQRGDLTIHLSVSPSSILWASPALTTPDTQKVVRLSRSIERAAAFRKEDPVPTVLELTFTAMEETGGRLIDRAIAFLAEGWPRVRCETKFALIDLGGEWLFFPKSGFNPNVTSLSAYYTLNLFSDWQRVRKLHNASISDLNGTSLDVCVHSEHPHRSPDVFGIRK